MAMPKSFVPDAPPSAAAGMPKSFVPDAPAADSTDAPEPTIGERAVNFARSFLPATRSPIGWALDKATGGAYGEVAPTYDALSPPPDRARRPDESEREYALAGLREGGDKGAAMAGLVVSRLAPVVKIPVPQPAAGGVLERAANRLAASTLKGTAGEYKALGPEEVQSLGRWLLKNGAVEAFDTPKSVAAKVEPLKATAQANLDRALTELDATGATGLDKAKLRDAYVQAAIDAEKQGPAMQPIVDKYLAAAADVEKEIAKGPTGSFTEGEQWKRGYQKVAYPKGKPPIDPSASQVADMDIASIARQHVEDAANGAAQGSDLAERFVQAKRDFGAAKTAERLTAGAEARAEARNLAQPSDKAAAMTSLLTGHGPIASALVGLANKVTRERASSTLAALADRLAGAGAPSQGTPRAGSAIPVFSAAAARAESFPQLAVGVRPAAAQPTPTGSAAPAQPGSGSTTSPGQPSIPEEQRADHFIRWMTDPTYRTSHGGWE